MPSDFLYSGVSVSYNGHSFTQALKMRIESTPVYDDSNRAVKYLQYKITITDVVQDDAGAGNSLPTIYAKLVQPGGELFITGTAFSTISLNGDLVQGPKPRMLSWQPLGGTAACRLTWQCEAAVTPCLSENSTGPMAYGYEESWSIDMEGMTTRRVSGYLDIAVYQAAGSRASDNADSYRDLIIVAVPTGFRRTSQEYRLSADRARLNFTIVDTQLPTPFGYPPHLIDIQVDQRTESRLPLTTWFTTFTGRIIVNHNVSKLWAWRGFLLIVQQRREFAKKGKEEVGKDSYFLLQSLSFNEQLFQHTCSFSMTFQHICKFEDILKASGLFRPIEGDWTTWAQSMEIPWKQRGHANLKFSEASDVITSLCDPVQIPVIADDAALPTVPDEEEDVMANEPPEPETSYTDYQSRVRVVTEDDTVKHKPMQPQYDASGVPVFPEDGFDKKQTGGVIVNPESSASGGGGEVKKDVIQSSGRKSCWVMFFGLATRVHFKPAVPRVTEIGGVPAREIWSDIREGISGHFFGLAEHLTQWKIAYELEEPIKGPIKAPKNLFTNFGFDAAGIASSAAGLGSGGASSGGP